MGISADSKKELWGRLLNLPTKKIQGNAPSTSSQQTYLDWRVALFGSIRGLEDKKEQEKNSSFKLCILL